MPPTSLPDDDRPDVVLHVGMGKTGTSSLQARLHRNRGRLAKRGVLYPASPGKRRHIRLGLAMQPNEHSPRTSVDWRRQQVSTPAELRPMFEDALFEELAGSRASRVLLSDEALFGAAHDGIRNLRELLDRVARSVRVVVYLRRQDDHACSRYQQVVKRSGEVRRLSERVEEMDLSAVYDYHSRLVAWRDLMHPDELVVRTFEKDRFLGGSLFQDFLDATGIGIDPEELGEGPTRNESLDAESVEFLRLFNIHHRDLGETPGLSSTTQIIRSLERASSGPTLTLPADQLDGFMAKWEESNRAVARDFAPDGPETLFVSERKVRGTTTEQHLDPARLDHFFEVLDLPAEVHAPMRAIAEREAGR